MTNQTTQFIIFFLNVFFFQNPHDSQRSYRGLFPKDQTTGEMLLADGWRHGQARVTRGQRHVYSFDFSYASLRFIFTSVVFATLLNL